MRPYRYTVTEQLLEMYEQCVNVLHGAALNSFSFIKGDQRRQLRKINRELKRRGLVGPR